MSEPYLVSQVVMMAHDTKPRGTSVASVLFGDSLVAAILPFIVFIGAALAGDFAAGQLRSKKAIPLVNWLGASTGACVAVACFAACTGGLFFWVDPLYTLLQAPLFGGIIGALVDIPLLIGRGVKRRTPAWDTVLEVAIILVSVSAFVALVVVIQRNYKQTVLPI